MEETTLSAKHGYYLERIIADNKLKLLLRDVLSTIDELTKEVNELQERLDTKE